MKYMMFVCTDTEPDPPTGDPKLDDVERLGGAPRRQRCPRHGRGVAADRRRHHRAHARREGARHRRPFAETREWIAGFDILECADLDEAIEIASQHPMAASAVSSCVRSGSTSRVARPRDGCGTADATGSRGARRLRWPPNGCASSPP